MDAWRHARHLSGQTANLALPRTVEDKYLWRKVFDHDPLHVTVSDKLAVKDYVRAKSPGLDIPETLWSGGNLGDMPRDLITGGAVLKINNASGRTLLLNDPGFDLDALRARTKDWKNPYGLGLREWAYGQIEPKFMLEALIPGATAAGSMEFRCHFFSGQPFIILQTTHPAVDLSPDAHLTALTTGGSEHTVTRMHLIDGTPVFHPYHADVPLRRTDFEGLEQAFEFGRILAADFDAVRVDLYKHGDALHFGELTLYPNAGGLLADEETRMQASAMWSLRDTWFLTTPQPGWRGLYAKWLRRKLR